MKRTLSLSLALILAATLVYAGTTTLHTPTDQTATGTDSVDDATPDCAAVASDAVSATHDGVFVTFTYEYDDGGLGSTGSIEVSWDGGSTWPDIKTIISTVGSTVDRLPSSSEKASQDISLIQIRACADMATSGTAETRLTAWTIDQVSGRRLLMVVGG